MIYYAGDAAILVSPYLEHHGIKGMKWGVRRFQNQDGSYTDAGRARYGLAQRHRDAAIKRKRVAALRKYRKDQVNANPYGKLNKSGKQSYDQYLRYADDKSYYGRRAPQRIQARIDSGKTYKQAKRPEQLRRAGLVAVTTLATTLVYDQMYLNGALRKDFVRRAQKGAKAAKAAYKTMKARKSITKIGAGTVVNEAGRYIYRDQKAARFAAKAAAERFKGAKAVRYWSA